MTTLIQKLTAETQILKIEFLEKTEKYAVERYNQALKQNKYTALDWCRVFGLTPEKHNEGRVSEFLGFPKNFYNSKLARTLDGIKNKNRRISSMKLEDFIEKEKKNAVLHYENSIIKLAARIEKKGLDLENVTMKTGRVGVNIETTITDGNKVVKAWTIVAQGEIQQPHYRYLVK